MDCTESLSRLHAYLDQELDLPSVVAIDQHLAACAACKAAFAAQSALQSAILQHADYHHGAPQALADRIRARLGTAPKARASTFTLGWRWPQLRHWLPVGAAAAAAAVISWSVAIEYASLPADQVIAEQVITGHARAVLGGHPIEVASSDQHTVKPWLSARLDFSPPVTDLAGAGYPLAGGRLDYLDNRPVAALVYQYRQHVINLFVWPDEKAGRASPRALSKHGYNVLHWTDAGMTFWAISDVNPAELRSFAEAYASAR